MPTRQTVEDFIALVVGEKHVEAIESFYHENASMQENFNTPRIGREALIAHEKQSLNAIKSMTSHPPKTVIVDGNNVAIQWVFEIIDPLGQRRSLEEVALQTWQDDRIIKEQFFYDSAKAWQLID